MPALAAAAGLALASPRAARRTKPIRRPAPARRRRQRPRPRQRALRQPRRRGLERAGGRAAGVDRRVPGRQPGRHDRLRPGWLGRRTRAVHRRRHRSTAAPTRPQGRRADWRAEALRRRRTTWSRSRSTSRRSRSSTTSTASTTCSSRRRRWRRSSSRRSRPGTTRRSRPTTRTRRFRARASRVVNRSDESGTTAELHGLPGRRPRRTSGRSSPTQKWPVKGGEAAQGTSGVVDAVKNGKGTIGYADESQAGELGIAKIKVGDAFVAPTPEAAAKVVELSKESDDPGKNVFTYDARPHDDRGAAPTRSSWSPTRWPAPSTTTPLRARSSRATSNYVISADGQDAAAQERRLGADQRRGAHEDPAGRRRDRRELARPTTGA